MAETCHFWMYAKDFFNGKKAHICQLSADVLAICSRKLMITNRQISAIRFQAGSQLQKDAYILKLPYLFLIVCQIWLNLLIDDGNFGYITRWRKTTLIIKSMGGGKFPWAIVNSKIIKGERLFPAAVWHCRCKLNNISLESSPFIWENQPEHM